MFVCSECGLEFEEPKKYSEYVGEFWGFPARCDYDGCPKCGGNFEEMEEEE